jgi:phage shock protein PspC (stress-responsive transcriptional regulator)
MRNDTFLGVCEALGEDFRLNPFFLRVAFAATLLFAPVAVIGTYLGLGALVALSRWMAPNPRTAAPDEAAAEPAAAELADEQRELNEFAVAA